MRRDIVKASKEYTRKAREWLERKALEVPKVQEDIRRRVR